MTVFPDARTPSADLHTLAGSTPPGAARPMQPFGVATAPAANLGDTFVPLGGAALDAVASLAARRALAHPDAEVIDLAGRVKRLAERENRVVLRTCKIEDAVFDAMRADPRPKEAESKIRITSTLTFDEDGTRVTTIREPAGWAAESRANRKAYEAALDARKRREEQEGARRDLPYWMKLRERASSRLYRWILQLADTEPTTQAGLAAKAAAVEAIAEDGGEKLPCDEHQRLAASLSRDVVRLAATQADNEKTCTCEEAATLDFEPWTDECVVPPNSEWTTIGDDLLPILRLAWMLNRQTKEQMMTRFAEINSEDPTALQRLWDDTHHAAMFFQALHEVAHAADSRMLVALSTMMGDGRYAHHFTDRAGTPAASAA